MLDGSLTRDVTWSTCVFPCRTAHRELPIHGPSCGPVIPRRLCSSPGRAAHRTAFQWSPPHGPSCGFPVIPRRLCGGPRRTAHRHRTAFRQKNNSSTGNRTLVSRVTGGDTDHYTIEDLLVMRSLHFWLFRQVSGEAWEEKGQKRKNCKKFNSPMRGDRHSALSNCNLEPAALRLRV